MSATELRSPDLRPGNAWRRLGLGTATLLPGYGLGSSAEAHAFTQILRSAIERGIRYIDTAAAYGASEEMLGQMNRELHDHEVRICTKVSVEEGDDADAILERIAESLRRLNAEAVDTCLVHSASGKLLRGTAVRTAIEKAAQDGRIGKAGASTYGTDDARSAAAMPWCDVVQIECSILNQSVVDHPFNPAPSELVARSVLCKGLLTDRRRLASNIEADVLQTIDRLEALASSWDFTLPELAIRFALDHPRVDMVVVGVSSQDELDLACRAASRKPLSEDQMEELKMFDCSRYDAVHPERWTTSR